MLAPPGDAAAAGDTAAASDAAAAAAAAGQRAAGPLALAVEARVSMVGYSAAAAEAREAWGDCQAEAVVVVAAEAAGEAWPEAGPTAAPSLQAPRETEGENQAGLLSTRVAPEKEGEGATSGVRAGEGEGSGRPAMLRMLCCTLPMPAPLCTLPCALPALAGASLAAGVVAAAEGCAGLRSATDADAGLMVDTAAGGAERNRSSAMERELDCRHALCQGNQDSAGCW
jgi:hypothetical protein